MSKQQNQERVAAIAFILDRVEQYGPASGYRSFVDELVGGLAEGRHIECARAGEYDDLKERVRAIIASREGVAPLVRRRRNLRSVRQPQTQMTMMKPDERSINVLRGLLMAAEEGANDDELSDGSDGNEPWTEEDRASCRRDVVWLRSLLASLGELPPEPSEDETRWAHEFIDRMRAMIEASRAALSQCEAVESGT